MSSSAQLTEVTPQHWRTHHTPLAPSIVQRTQARILLLVCRLKIKPSRFHKDTPINIKVNTPRTTCLFSHTFNGYRAWKWNKNQRHNPCTQANNKCTHSCRPNLAIASDEVQDTCLRSYCRWHPALRDQYVWVHVVTNMWWLGTISGDGGKISLLCNSHMVHLFPYLTLCVLPHRSAQLFTSFNDIGYDLHKTLLIKVQPLTTVVKILDTPVLTNVATNWPMTHDSCMENEEQYKGGKIVRPVKVKAWMYD